MSVARFSQQSAVHHQNEEHRRHGIGPWGASADLCRHIRFNYTESKHTGFKHTGSKHTGPGTQGGGVRACRVTEGRSNGQSISDQIGQNVAKDQDFIGPYRLLKLVRVGANCQIWEAISEADHQRYALKALRDEYRSDKEHIAMLKQEFTVGKTLDHPHIIKIYNFRIDRGVPYLVMEYFESENLKQWIRSRQSEAEALEQLPRIVKKCVAALAYMHEQGWIHRDVKPDNFLVNQQIDVRLIDFAIAERPRKGLGRLFAGRGRIQGTRSYMSPEQIRGEAVDPRSDIYSLGCVLFELVAGRAPFTGSTPDELLQKHLRSPAPSLVAHNKEVTSEFADLVARMMAKKRGDRPESMRAILDELDNMRIVRRRRA